MIKPIEKSFSIAQKTALQIVGKSSAMLSIIGSSYIIYYILYRKRRRSNQSSQVLHSVYHRLLCSMSLCDLISSSAFFIGSWSTPKEDQQQLVVFNIGNQTTCDITGFMLQFGMLSVPIYNTFLSV